jgi:indolepyruvate decarboxylase
MAGRLGDFLIERLLSNGVKHVFGVPGDYNLGFYNKLSKSGIEVIGTTSEANAGFAADAYSRIHGIGCVLVTYCVGGFNLINSIGGAFAEKSPVIVISGSPGMKEREEKVLLHHMVGHFECQHKVFSNITCANTVLRDPERAGYEIDRVLEAVRQYKQPVYIELPRDMVEKAIRYDPYTIGTPKEFQSDPENLTEALSEATEWINESKRPVIWAGVEIARFGLGERLMKFIETTGIPVATDILGKSVVNEKHPLCLGVYSESTSCDEVRDYIAESDCLIMLGVMMTDMNLGFLPLRCQRRQTLNASSQELTIRNHSFRDVKFTDFVLGLAKSKITRRQTIVPKPKAGSFICQKERKLTSVRLFEKVNSILTDEMIVVADIGDALFGSLDLIVPQDQYISPAFYTSMGFAVPGALGVQAAKPDKRAIVLVGDGSFHMSGVEFSTLVRRAKMGYKSNAIIFVINNGGYGTERILMDGSFNDIQSWNFENMPSLVDGGFGAKVTTEDELERVCATALGSKQPFIINAIIDKDDHTPALKRMFGKLAKKV